MSRACLSSLLLALLAQDPAAKPIDLPRAATAILLPFAKVAETNKVLSQAKSAYELCIQYDSDCKPARLALGYRQLGTKWQAEPKPKSWVDSCTPAQKQNTDTAWQAVQKQLAALHRSKGVELLATDRAAGTEQLQRALAYDPLDAEAHKALGHFEHNGFFGTEQQIAFLQQLAAFEAAAKKLRTQTYEVEALPAEQLPAELKQSGLEFNGARSPNFTLWVRPSLGPAKEVALWAERARDFLILLLGKQKLGELNFKARLTYDFIAFTGSESERDQFLTANPATWKGQELMVIRRFDDFFWDRPGGRGSVVWTLPDRVFDRMVGYVVFQGFLQGRNEGLGEGLLHASTWYLLGSTWTWYGSLPATMAPGQTLLQPTPEAWRARLREQIAKREDWPLAQVPRERLTHFRPEVRVKSWSVMSWLVARYPEQWLAFFLELSKNKSLMPEQVEAIAKQAFGRALGEIEIEWREWADGQSAFARASGHGR